MQRTDAMHNLPEMVALPLKMDANGIIHVSNTRVTLDVLIAQYHMGDSPETIHENFDVVPLNDVYAVIAYYLAHQDALDVYLRQREAESADQRRQAEARYTAAQKARREAFKRMAEEKLN